MGRLVIDGKKVYTVDEACMRRKNISLEQIPKLEHAEDEPPEHDKKRSLRSRAKPRRS